MLMACVSACMGKEAPPDPLVNPRGEYSFSNAIRFVGGERQCTVYVDVSQALLDAWRKRDGEGRVPCLVLRRQVAGNVGFPVNPIVFSMKRSEKPSHLEGHVTYEVVVSYDLLFRTNIDIQSMTFEMLPNRKRPVLLNA